MKIIGITKEFPDSDFFEVRKTTEPMAIAIDSSKLNNQTGCTIEVDKYESFFFKSGKFGIIKIAAADEITNEILLLTKETYEENIRLSTKIIAFEHKIKSLNFFQRLCLFLLKIPLGDMCGFSE